MRTVAFWLSLILIFVIPWENMILIKNLGTVGRATGLLVAAFWVVTIVVMGRFRKPHPFHLAVYLFVLWNIVSVFWSVDVDITVDRLLTYFQVAGMVYVLWDLYTSSAALRAGLQAYVLGAYLSIGSIVVNYFMGNTYNVYTTARTSATGFNPDDIGLILALGVPVAWHLAVSECSSKTTQILRVANYAYIPASFLGMVLTATRGSLIAALPAFLFVIGSLTRLRLYMRVLLFTALIGSLFVLLPLVPQSSFQRLATTGTSIAEGDLGGRVDIWREGVAILSENPLLGVGSGAFRIAVESGKVAHNSFLSVLVEVGPIGFVLFVVMLAIAVHQAVYQPKWDSRLWLVVLLVWALGVFSLTWEHTKPTWLFLSLVVVGANLSARRGESVTRVIRQTPQIATRRKEKVFLE